MPSKEYTHLRSFRGSAGRGLFAPVIGNCRLDSVLRKHRAMQFDRWEAELLCDFSVFDFLSFDNIHAHYTFSEETAAGNCGAAAKGLEFNVDDLARVVNTDLQFHNITTSRCTDESGSDIQVILGQRANIAWLFVVVNHFFVVLAGEDR